MFNCGTGFTCLACCQFVECGQYLVEVNVEGSVDSY
jgi:hypothetical protein